MNPMAEAMKWLSKITTVGLMFVIPIVVGGWLDGRALGGYGVGTIGGLVFGFAAGLYSAINLLSEKKK